jgi:hypothetical protein
MTRGCIKAGKIKCNVFYFGKKCARQTKMVGCPYAVQIK